MDLEGSLNKHTVKNLKNEIAKVNIKGYSKLKKKELIKLMVSHAEKFQHLIVGKIKEGEKEKHRKAAKKPEEKPLPKVSLKPLPKVSLKPLPKVSLKPLPKVSLKSPEKSIPKPPAKSIPISPEEQRVKSLSSRTRSYLSFLMRKEGKKDLDYEFVKSVAERGFPPVGGSAGGKAFDAIKKEIKEILPVNEKAPAKEKEKASEEESLNGLTRMARTYLTFLMRKEGKKDLTYKYIKSVVKRGFPPLNFEITDENRLNKMKSELKELVDK